MVYIRVVVVRSLCKCFRTFSPYPQLQNLVGMAAPARKLKILCLHGYRQNEASFRERTGALRKMLKSMAEFEEQQCGWWFSDSTRYDCDAVTDEDMGFAASVTFVQQVLEQQGPFDGILAFSQGASLLGVICRMKMTSESFNFKFVILVAGFRSLQATHQQYYSGDKLGIPSLHVIGDTDAVIACDRSQELVDMFVDPVILRHSGGHFIAAASAQKDTYKSFLKQFQ